MTTLLIATLNAHKVEEIRTILGESFRYLTLNHCPAAPTIVEDADTFAGNAEKKAVGLVKWLINLQPSTFNLQPDYILADDSGLEVDALGGAPGVHSARFAAVNGTSGNSPDADNNAKLLRLLKDVPLEKRTARFRCTLALQPLNSSTVSCQFFSGTCEGHIASAPSGEGGFGYDPLFIPRGFTQSFAELGEEIKNRLSHRAAALAQLRATWK